MSSLTLPAGFVRRSQLFELGVTRATLSTLLRRGELHRVFYDVYSAVPPRELGLDALCVAAQVYAEDNLVFTCHTALALVGAEERPGPLHATCPPDRRVRSTAGLVVHRLERCEPAAGPRRGHLVVPRGLAAVQAFGCLPTADRGAYLLGAVQQGVVRASDIAPFVTPNATGRKELLELLHLAATGTHSAGELRMLFAALRRHGLPDPERQHRVVLPTGPIYLDAAYLKAKVGLEYDGRQHHFTAAARIRDITRDAELSAEGWLLIRCTDVQLRGGLARVFAEHVRRAVEARGGF